MEQRAQGKFKFMKMRLYKCVMKNEPLYFLWLLLSLVVAGLFLWVNVCSGQRSVGITKIIVDPGHGGQDSGAKGSGGIQEKKVSLDLARKLVQTLEDTGTVRAVLTRTDDYAISLDDRAGLANHRGGDILISLHLGDFFAPVPAAAGFTTYYWSPTISSPIVSPPSDRGQPWDQGQRPYWEQSRRLATLIQQELTLALTWPSGGVLQADLYLLKRVWMPAVLIEIGSLNHPGEATELQKPAFQQAVARALTEAILKFRDTHGKDISAPIP